MQRTSDDQNLFYSARHISAKLLYRIALANYRIATEFLSLYVNPGKFFGFLRNTGIWNIGEV